MDNETEVKGSLYKVAFPEPNEKLTPEEIATATKIIDYYIWDNEQRINNA